MILLLASFALADIPPPDDYVETCTVAQACEGEGVACGDAYFGDRGACARQYAEQGYTRACKTRGASTWTEVWCLTGEPEPIVVPDAEPKPDEEAKPEPPAPAPVPEPPAPTPTPEPPTPDIPKDNRGCSHSPSSLGWLALPLLFLVRRRR